MNPTLHPPILGDFDHPWRRFPAIFLVALILWLLLLASFTRVLHWRPPPAPVAPIDARLIELPPAAGLQGGPAAAAPSAAHPAPKALPVAKPKPIVHHRLVHHPIHQLHHRMAPVHAPAKSEPAAASPTAGATGARPGMAKPTADGVAGGSGGGHGAGVGGDAAGARALYAPMPTIPDDLRENPLSTVAIAAFEVAPDGSAQVRLIQATTLPRLNYILLQSLRQWRFFPAVRKGKPVSSEFQVRIPISIQ